MSTTPTPSKSAKHSRSGTTEPTVLLEDLTAGLIWPNLLKAPSMAFSPPRWLLGIMGVFVILIIHALHAWIFNINPPPNPSTPADALTGFEPVMWSLFTLNPGMMFATIMRTAHAYMIHFSEDPWTNAVFILPMLLAVGIFGFAITRSASIQYAHGRQTDAVSALSAALRFIRQIALATLGPLLLCAILAALVSLIGLTLGLPVFNIIGSLLYLLGLIVSIVIVCILVLHISTLPISISALSIEGTDGFDAIQRSYAYLIARPLRLAIYAMILLAVGSLITAIVGAIAGWSIELADGLISSLSNDAGRRVLNGTSDMGATEPFAHSVITLIRSALELIVAGYVFSLIFCSTTLAYLCIRRICDGQDINEVWDPS